MIADTHIVLVSVQAAPNLLPALDPELKPKEVIMLVSAKMQTRADALESVLKQSGIKVSRVPLNNEHDFSELENTLMTLAAEREGQSIAINVTGGTKLMALAAQSIAQAAQWPVFYVDVDTDEITWIGHATQTSRKLNQQLRLRHYLQGYGFKIVEDIARPQSNPVHDRLIQTLLVHIGSLENPLSQLNWLVQCAEDKRQLQIQMDDRQRDSIALQNLLRNFEEAKVLTLENDRIVFPNETLRSFAKGGWLEQYVYQTIASLTGELGIRDKATNLQVEDASGVRNELDVAFIAKNRLFVIECKTARMDRPEAPKANDTLFKLAETSSRIGGLGSQKMLASYRALRDSEKKLANALGIRLVCGSELTRLDEKIKEWVR